MPKTLETFDSVQYNDIKEDNVGWIEKDGKKELRIIDDVDIWTEEEILQDKYISVLDKDYNPQIDFNENFEKTVLEETLLILALIYRDYFISKEERENLIKKLFWKK